MLGFHTFLVEMQINNNSWEENLIMLTKIKCVYTLWLNNTTFRMYYLMCTLCIPV